MNYLKKYKILILATLIFIFLYFLILFSLNYTSYEGYFIFKNFGNYKCNNNKCIMIENEEIENLEQNFNLITDSTTYKNYHLEYLNSWNLFNENNDWIQINEDYIAYSQNLNLKKIEYKNVRSMNNEEKEFILKNNNINVSKLEKLDNNLVYELYLNNNEIKDKIILAGNWEQDDNSLELFNFIYIEIDGKKNIIVNEKYTNSNSISIPGYSLYFVYNVNDYKNTIITFTENYFSNTKSTNIYIFSTKNKKIRLLN